MNVLQQLAAQIKVTDQAYHESDLAWVKFKMLRDEAHENDEKLKGIVRGKKFRIKAGASILADRDTLNWPSVYDVSTVFRAVNADARWITMVATDELVFDNMGYVDVRQTDLEVVE